MILICCSNYSNKGGGLVRCCRLASVSLGLECCYRHCCRSCCPHYVFVHIDCRDLLMEVLLAAVSIVWSLEVWDINLSWDFEWSTVRVPMWHFLTMKCLICLETVHNDGYEVRCDEVFWRCADSSLCMCQIIWIEKCQLLGRTCVQDFGINWEK